MRKEKPPLTKTMLKIIALHASGHSLTEIAKKIYVSYSAVTNIMYDARARTKTATNAQLVMKAHSLDLISGLTNGEVFVLPVQD